MLPGRFAAQLPDASRFVDLHLTWGGNFIGAGSDVFTGGIVPHYYTYKT